MTIQDWKYIDKSQGGHSYYYTKWQGYEIELHDVNGGIEIGIYKKGEIQKPPFRLEIPIEDFQPRYTAIMDCIKDILDSLTQDYVAQYRRN